MKKEIEKNAILESELTKHRPGWSIIIIIPPTDTRTHIHLILP